MTKSIVSAVLMTSTLALVGCSGAGTTYGTGTSHEQATMKSLGNLFSLKNKQENISYNSRPELVMPANRNLLPQPAQQQALQADPNWPVSPEQRIAAAQSAAPVASTLARSGGDLPTEFLTDTNKQGISKSRITGTGDSVDKRRVNIRSGGDQFIKDFQDDANGTGKGKLARERRDQISFSTGIKRKFLTEPPVEYRTPSANAEAGDLGISKEVIDERLERAKKDQQAVDRGIIAPTGAGS